MRIATNSEKIDITLEVDTVKLAENFPYFKKKVVFLYGKMGVGKPFIKHLINNFQKNNDLKQTEVTSPINLVNEYDSGDFVIHHYDLFRLKNIQEINNIGFLKILRKLNFNRVA